MFDVGTIKKVSLMTEFREDFPEFKDLYAQIDMYGGSNCTSCNKRKQNSIFRKIAQEIIMNEEIKKRYSNFFKDNKVEAVPLKNTNLAALPYDSKKFAQLFFFKEVIELFEEFFPEDVKEILLSMHDKGLYDDSLVASLDNLKDKVYSSFVIFQKLYNIVTTSDIHAKLMTNSLSCKIITGWSIANLENKINEFCLARPIVSVNKDDLHAIILYR